MGCEIVREIPKTICQVLEKVAVSRERRGRWFQISQKLGGFINKVCRDGREVCGCPSVVWLGVICRSIVEVATEDVQYLLMGP